MDPEDRDSLRFLWVEDVRDSTLIVVVYRFWVKYCLTLFVELDDKKPSGYLYTEVDPEFVKRMIEGFYVI